MRFPTGPKKSQSDCISSGMLCNTCIQQNDHEIKIRYHEMMGTFCPSIFPE
jgi:hypothetical protein